MRRIVILGLAATLLVLGVLAWLRAGRAGDTSDAGEVVVVAPRTFSSTVVAVGAVKPRIGSEVRVGSRISGRVRKLRANIGDRVEQGQVIAELETAELDALIAQRRAELRLVDARLAAFATLSPEEEARARADVTRFQAAAQLAAEELGRQRELLEHGVVPRAVAEAAMIEVEDLTRSYRRGTLETPVLEGVSFRVRRGEFVAIMGRSGSGKSTLLDILGLLDTLDGGRYVLDGTDFSKAGDDERSVARNRKIGFVFQQFHLLERASAAQNVTLPLLYAEDDVDDAADRAARALEAVGLSHRARHFPGELSGGEQQRVAIARALMNAPALILADEPTGNLDAQSGAEILDIFRRLVDGGRTLVLVTHDKAVAERADRIMLLDDGRIVGDEAIPRAVERAPVAADLV